MRLYHHPMSSNAQRAVITALHLEAKVDFVMVDLAKGEQRKPDYLRKNPNGKVPLLVDDDGFALWESHAIMQYLADKTPNQTIYPTAPRARADVNRWLFWNAHHFAPAVAILNWERVVKPMIGGGPTSEPEVARGEKLVGDLAHILDAHLAGREWIAEERLTLADLAIATPLAHTESAKLPVASLRNVGAWFARVRALPAWRHAPD